MSPVGALQAALSAAFQIPKDAPRGLANPPAEATSQASEAAAKSASSAIQHAGQANETGGADDATSSYTTRTSFNAATGEWTLVVERHPPESGVTVAEQKGFLSQYLARASSSASVQTAVSMRI